MSFLLSKTNTKTKEEEKIEVKKIIFKRFFQFIMQFFSLPCEAFESSRLWIYAKWNAASLQLFSNKFVHFLC